MAQDLTFTNLGAESSAPDYRDRKDVALAAPRPSSFATDLGPVEIFNQEKIGICTSNLVTIIEYLYWKKTGVYTKLSRRFMYAVGKNLIDQNPFEGSSLRTMLKVAYNFGVPRDELYPSAVNGMSHADYEDINKIPSAAWIDALNYKIGSYIRVPDTQEDFLQHLYKYGLLYSRMEIGKEWWTAEDGTVTWAPDRILPLDPPKVVISGHAIVHRKYEQVQPALGGFTSATLRNSWGPGWAQNGDGYHTMEVYAPTEAWAVTLDRFVNDLPAAKDFKHTFNTNLQRFQRSEEVKNLQIALMILGYLDYVQPVDRGYYGALTAEAVKEFLISKNIWPNYAGLYFGPRGRAAMNVIFAN